jgi:tyrosyl-tRNA synthetase
MGTELVRKVTGKTAYGLTSPLITKSDGTKFGKSEGGNERVWLDASRTSPFAFYQFFVNVDDDMTALLLRFLTFLDHDTISQLDIDTRERPAERLAQKALAKALVTLVHGDAAAQQALTASDALFSEEISSLDERTLLDATADAPRTTMARRDFDSGLPVVDLLVRCALASSKAEARRFVEQGGVYINNRRLDADVVTLDGAMHGRYLLVRRGRRHVHLVVAE